MKEKKGVEFHPLTYDEVLTQLECTDSGLSIYEVEKRKNKYEKNTLPVKEAPGFLKVFVMQFMHPLIYILLAATIASIAIVEYFDMAFIMLVILLNSSLGAYKERNAEKSALTLQNLLKIRALVKRNNKEVELDSSELVPGDIVLPESGNKIPADMRLIEARGLSLDESFFTGESVAATKQVLLC